MGRTRVLPVRPVLHDARNLPAPIISVIIGLPLPVFATACILLPAALPLQPLCLLCLLCLLCRSSQPACPPPALPALPALPLCRSAAPASLPAKKARLFKVSLFYYPVWVFARPPPRLSARQSRKPSRTSCSRILAQSATGCFSPSMNRSGHPRLQSSM